MKNISKKPGLYLHIPFCDTKCGYCDFYSITNNSLRSAFIDALIQEVNHYKTEPFTLEEYDTIYLGGGTPSLLSPLEMEQIFKTLFDTFPISGDCEITVEVNPGTIDKYKLDSYKTIGINRLSIGVQSFDANELKTLGRIHDRHQALKTYDQARSAGFTNISLDLIYALPNQNLQTWNKNVETCISLEPDHISAYNLIYEANTPFYTKLIRGEFIQQSAEEETAFFLQTINSFEKSGFIPYEISSYAKSEETYSRHNYKYWNHSNYLSFGPSAHSYWNKKRWSNIRSIGKYISNLEQKRSVMDFSETLAKKTLIFESIMLSLRTFSGIDLRQFKTVYNESFLGMHSQISNDLLDNGFAVIENQHFKLTRKGMLVSDEILSNFVPN